MGRIVPEMVCEDLLYREPARIRWFIASGFKVFMCVSVFFDILPGYWFIGVTDTNTTLSHGTRHYSPGWLGRSVRIIDQHPEANLVHYAVGFGVPNHTRTLINIKQVCLYYELFQKP